MSMCGWWNRESALGRKRPKKQKEGTNWEITTSTAASWVFLDSCSPSCQPYSNATQVQRQDRSPPLSFSVSEFPMLVQQVQWISNGPREDDKRIEALWKDPWTPSYRRVDTMHNCQNNVHLILSMKKWVFNSSYRSRCSVIKSLPFPSFIWNIWTAGDLD